MTTNNKELSIDEFYQEFWIRFREFMDSQSIGIELQYGIDRQDPGARRWALQNLGNRNFIELRIGYDGKREVLLHLKKPHSCDQWNKLVDELTERYKDRPTKNQQNITECLLGYSEERKIDHNGNNWNETFVWLNEKAIKLLECYSKSIN